MFRLVHKLDVPGAGGLLCPLFASEDKTKRDAFIEAFQSCKRLLENDKVAINVEVPDLISLSLFFSIVGWFLFYFFIFYVVCLT